MQSNNELVDLTAIQPSETQLVSLDSNSLSQQRQIAKKKFYSDKKTMTQQVQESKSVTEIMSKTIDQMARSYDNLSGTQQMLLDNGQVLNSKIV